MQKSMDEAIEEQTPSRPLLQIAVSQTEHPMQILAGVLIAMGFAGAIVALGILIYVLPHASYKSPDWMTVLLRSYRPHIIAYFVLFASSAMAFGLAAYIQKHAP